MSLIVNAFASFERDIRPRFGGMYVNWPLASKEIEMSMIGESLETGFVDRRAAVNPAERAFGERRQFSTTCTIDGPLALDNALSERAARVKGVTGEDAGRADILLVPDIEAGNVLAKSFTYLTGGRMAGVVVGAAAPVVLTSRADSAENKLYSMAVAVLMSAFERDLELKIGKVHF